jgi:hypothetical protein
MGSAALAARHALSVALNAHDFGPFLLKGQRVRMFHGVLVLLKLTVVPVLVPVVFIERIHVIGLADVCYRGGFHALLTTTTTTNTNL